MDEYLGLPREHDQSYWYFMHDTFSITSST